MVLLLPLLLRYEGGGPRLSRRIGELPFPAGRAGGGRAVLVRSDVVTKRSARARYSPWLEEEESARCTPLPVREPQVLGEGHVVLRPPCCTVTRAL